MNTALTRRRTVAAWASLMVAICALAAGAVAIAQQPVKSNPVKAAAPKNQQGRQVSLFDQLRIGLKAVTKEDFAFLNLVVLRVNQGKLPRVLVDSTFLWARNRYSSRSGRHRLRPMVYFKPALIARAKKLGVIL